MRAAFINIVLFGIVWCELILFVFCFVLLLERWACKKRGGQKGDKKGDKKGACQKRGQKRGSQLFRFPRTILREYSAYPFARFRYKFSKLFLYRVCICVTKKKKGEEEERTKLGGSACFFTFSGHNSSFD